MLKLINSSLCDKVRSWLGPSTWFFIAITLVPACSGPRETTADYSAFRARLDEEDVLVEYFKNVRQVHQSEPDLCWAAALEQALVQQGVDLDEKRVVAEVHPKTDADQDRSNNLLQWYQISHVLKETLRDGSETWVRIDFDQRDPDMFRYDFTSEIATELSANRIPLVGISTGFRQGHMVSVIGAAYPIDVKRLTTYQIVGFLIYDPLTAKPYLTSVKELFANSEVIVSVVTFKSKGEAMFYCSLHCRRSLKKSE